MKKVTICIFIIYLLDGLAEITVFPYIYGGAAVAVIRYGCYLWFLTKVMHDIILDRRFNTALIIAAAAAVPIIIYSGKMQAGAVVLVLYAMSDIDTDRVIKSVLGAVFVFFVTVVILSAIQVIPCWQFHRDDKVRYALGFHYPTDAHSVFLSIVLMYIYCYGEKARITLLSALLAANCTLFYFTDGRLGFILASIAIVYAIIQKKIKDKLRLPLSICCALPTVLTAISLVLTFFMSEGIINDILSDRLLLSRQAFNEHPLTLFGTEIEWYGWGGFGYTELPQDFEYNYVDISYIRILFDFGIAGAVLIIAGYTRLLTSLCKQNAYNRAAITALVLLWAFIEPIIILPTRNVFVLLLAERYRSARRK